MATSNDMPMTAEQFAASLGNRQLHCRELGHTWRPLTVSYDRKSHAYDRTLRCSSCHTVRSQVLDSHGSVLSNGYKYPDGYLATNVEPGSTRDAFRVESVVRFLHSHNLDKKRQAS